MSNNAADCFAHGLTIHDFGVAWTRFFAKNSPKYSMVNKIHQTVTENQHSSIPNYFEVVLAHQPLCCGNFLFYGTFLY